MENNRVELFANQYLPSTIHQTGATYTKNLQNNKEKLSFFGFLMYSTKVEIYICEFHSLLFWVSLLEIFLYLIGLLLFISSPHGFGEFWAFTTHLIRATLGLVLLKRLPNSSTVIEEIKESEDYTVEDVQNRILQIYKNLLTNNKHRLLPIIISYLVFTIVDIIVDNVIFFFLLNKWSDSEYSLHNIFTLVLIITFFCKIYS